MSSPPRSATNRAEFDELLGDLLRDAERSGVPLTTARDVEGLGDDYVWMVEISRVSVTDDTQTGSCGPTSR